MISAESGREADPAVPRRLDFDGEGMGTAILTPTREDVDATLRIIGVH